MALPPKKWFGDNFETIFLDERMAGLQIFINNILLNKHINNWWVSLKGIPEFLSLDLRHWIEDLLIWLTFYYYLFFIL